MAVSRHRLLRFVIPPAAARPDGEPAADLVLLPFWHLQALLYGWDVGKRVTVEEDRDPYQADTRETQGEPMPRQIRRDSGPLRAFRGRVVDLTLPDPSARALGVTSLRLRASVFALEPFAARHESLGRVAPPRLALPEAEEQLRIRAIHLGDPTQGMTRLDVQRLDLLCEEMALYYYPFWRASSPDGAIRLWDAVSGAPEALGARTALPEAASQAVFDELKVLELRCQQCNEPLPAGNHSMVLPCTHCGQFWQVTRDGLSPFSASYARPVGNAEDARVWLPFWRVPVELRYGGKLARRVLDLRNVLGVLRPPFEVPREPPEAPLSFFAAAFGSLRAPRIDHAARDMTRIQPRLKTSPPPSGSELYQCFFSAEDAQRLAYTTFIQILPGVVPHRLRSLRITTGPPALWYIPFAETGRELRNLTTGVRYDRMAFRGLRH